MKIKIKNKTYEINLVNNEISRKIISYLPVKGSLVKWGGEIYLLVDFDIEIKEENGKIFDIGDIIYWKSSKTGNKGIAIFFGNTPNSDKPKTNENCDCKLIGKLKENNFDISDVEKGDLMEIL